MTRKNECIDEARKALNLFTGEELESYIKFVSTRERELRDAGVPFPRQAAMEEINKEHLGELLEDSARIARDIGKWDVIDHKMDADIAPRSFLEKTSKNTDYNVETAINSAKQVLHNRAFDTFTKEELDMLAKGEIDDAVYEVADGFKHHDPVITKIGNKLREFIESRNSLLIKTDAMRPSQMNKDRFFGTMYDASILNKMGKENWVTRQKELINIEETFKNTRAVRDDGSINESVVDEMIGNTYDNIIKGNGVLFTRAAISREKEAIERTRHMFYKFKDWKSWGLANKEYGQKSLMKSWFSDIDTSGKQAGLAEIMGTQPQRTWLEMRHKQVAKEGATTPLIASKHALDDALFNNLLGVNKGVWNPTIANTLSSIRSLTSVARLGKIVLRSVPDVSNIAGMAQRAGVGYWQPFFSSIAHAFDLIPSASRKKIAKMMASSLKVQQGAIARHSGVEGMGNVIDRMSNKMFYGLGLDSWDRSNKMSAMAPIMERYGKDSSKSFNSLGKQQQAYLRRFNISEAEWDALRLKTQDGLFATDNINSMTDSEIRELWSKGDKIIPLSDYGSALYRKVFSMFDTAQEFSVLNPTAYVNMITTGNYQAGHPAGEAMRMMMQFKGYPIQYMRRVFLGGMQDFDSYQGKLMYALNMSIGVIALTQLSDVLTAISQGLTPPDPSKMTRHEQYKYYLKMLAGGMGVFGSILGDQTSSKNFAASLWGTPSWRFFADPLITGASLATGNLKGAKNAVRDFANVANPIATVPVISPYIDSILGNKPYLEPGQHPLF